MRGYHNRRSYLCRRHVHLTQSLANARVPLLTDPTCVEGSTFNPVSGQCEGATTTDPTCVEGSTFNPESGQCEGATTEAPTCTEGSTFNPATDQCEGATTELLLV